MLEIVHLSQSSSTDYGAGGRVLKRGGYLYSGKEIPKLELGDPYLTNFEYHREVG